ncbi:MAG: formate dehydrogenase accessory sulfurtransferase FdhD [Synergistes sp.]|nr:formate dehydrogenase accessory sulfurtransferase FdhD [Synergistes sp.]
MENFISLSSVTKLYKSGETIVTEDTLLCEKRISLVVDSCKSTDAVITYGHEKEWAVGNLFCRRIINSVSEIANITQSDTTIDVTTDKTAPQSRMTSHGDIHIPVSTKFSFDTVMSAVEWLSHASLFNKTGCVHSAAFVRCDNTRICLFEDISRHNAVDKAIGYMLINNIDTSECLLAVSGRVPEDMAQKAAAAGVPVIASISAATAEGVRVALKFGITLIGFARDTRMNVYSFPERIVPPKYSDSTSVHTALN